MITIVYLTSRREPKYSWFAESLTRQASQDFAWIKLVVVDFFAEEPGRSDVIYAPSGLKDFVHCTPKPCVWQGKYRLTKRDHFAASNARNTGLCHCKDGYVAFVDDLSVLLPAWYSRVTKAITEGYIGLGAYKKVKKLVVEQGRVVSFEEFPPGNDPRLPHAQEEPVPANGSMHYGASLIGPVEAYLKVNGFDEDCDSLGSEDYICGLMLVKAGYTLKYDGKMMTYESEEDHHIGTPMHRFDVGVSPNDKSHAILDFVLKGGRNTAPNYFGPGGIRALREKILAGEPFPIQQIPQHEWYAGTPLKDL